MLKTKQRPKTALFADCGDGREVHDFATLLGFGADGVCPYLAYEVLARMNSEGVISARSGLIFTDEELFYSYRKAAAKGILKVMSKMGISTLQSYKGAQVFEALGLDDEVMERCFTGTSSRIKGADFAALFEDLCVLHRSAYPAHTDATPLLRNPGNFHYRNDGEQHLNTPFGMVQLQQASKLNSKDAFKAYTKHLDEVNKSVTLRGVLKLKSVDKSKSIPISEVEEAKEIVKRFNTGHQHSSFTLVCPFYIQTSHPSIQDTIILSYHTFSSPLSPPLTC